VKTALYLLLLVGGITAWCYGLAVQDWTIAVCGLVAALASALLETVWRRWLQR
jgi:membrane protein implicated in regulation of membrane protease activity